MKKHFITIPVLVLALTLCIFGCGKDEPEAVVVPDTIVEEAVAEEPVIEEPEEEVGIEEPETETEETTEAAAASESSDKSIEVEGVKMTFEKPADTQLDLF